MVASGGLASAARRIPPDKTARKSAKYHTAASTHIALHWYPTTHLDEKRREEHRYRCPTRIGLTGVVRDFVAVAGGEHGDRVTAKLVPTPAHIDITLA